MTNSTHSVEPVDGFDFHHGDRLRKARDERGLTQEQLADISSVSRQSIANYEAGKPMRKLQRRALAMALGVSDEWLEKGVLGQPRRNDPPNGCKSDVSKVLMWPVLPVVRRLPLPCAA